MPESMQVYAHLRVRQDRRTYDPLRKLWLSKQVGHEQEIHNIVTDAGRVSIHTFIYGTAAQRSSANLGVGYFHIGLSDDATPPAAGDTTLTAELSGNGLDRAAANPTLPTGSGTQTVIQNIFTYTGGPPQGIQKAALFDDPTTGNMAHEVQFTQRTLFTNDTLTITYTITLS